MCCMRLQLRIFVKDKYVIVVMREMVFLCLLGQSELGL